MNAVSLRALTPADEPFLWEMLYEALFVPPGAAPFARAIIRQSEIARYVAGWGRAGDSGFIALAENPVGAIWIRRFSAAQPGYGYVDDKTPELTIALLPAWRGRGIGEQLITAILEAARYDYAAVSLSVSAANPARQLYERCGFLTEKIEGDTLTMCHRFQTRKE